MFRSRTMITCAALLSLAAWLNADVSITDSTVWKRGVAQRGHEGGKGKGAGDWNLVDASGLEWFVNTNMVAATSNSASGAASEANYTKAVTATTSAGGTSYTTLTDAFDGYNNVWVKIDGAATWSYYYNTGTPTFEASGRQAVFNWQTIDGVGISRKVYIPADDEFCRWLNIFTNTTTAANSSAPAATKTVLLRIYGNLGSNGKTLITGTSNGDLTADVSDLWVASMENYDAFGLSPDPRLGHVLAGVGGAIGVSGISFVNGNGQPYWEYQFTLAPGETAIIMNFCTGQPNKTDAAAKAAELSGSDGGQAGKAFDNMTDTERTQVINFDASVRLADLAPQRRWTTQAFSYPTYTTVTTRFRIWNTGRGTAGPFRVAVFLSQDAVLGAGDKLVHTQDVGGVSRGVSESIRVKFRSDHPVYGWYLIGFADTQYAVPEEDETNNIVANKIRKR
ncbi:MAG: CARDB domain-containing protein [Acidobacteriota bacterium]